MQKEPRNSAIVPLRMRSFRLLKPCVCSEGAGSSRANAGHPQVVAALRRDLDQDASCSPFVQLVAGPGSALRNPFARYSGTPEQSVVGLLLLASLIEGRTEHKPERAQGYRGQNSHRKGVL